MGSPGTASVPAGRSGPRRRGAVLVAAILAAALDQLREVGYAALTMDGVAAAAGTGKAALYRRWSNKDELVMDALTSALPKPSEVRLTGEARADMLELMRGVREAFALSQDAAFRAAKKGIDGGLGPVVQERVVEPTRARILEIIRAGVESGEFRPGAANEQTVSVAPAMLVYHFVTHGPDVPDAYLEAILDDAVLPMIRAV
ncbi:TetR/AcrR family transcriptional regulator C-terminal ligand-binding domain-containing protein [Nocardiopsis dassonvillei]|uniref:TetR-like C-terminal domain-containing protein n=1 Tax=Nocardiopsis dassonvillei TaxID=2014 RepID=UPI00200CFF0B|nr:TetR-like C-terminal domain-containing protein [Nocardiopsis dassonvillei]MCK9868531.1 TetR/AcrR family transcriptional regulator C-terminal ligand-binding domain-containing protein [Nocardiopsis dassonvillei]